ncbi:MAG: ribosome biogenesis GTPase Der [Bacteroidales bacterium]
MGNIIGIVGRPNVGKSTLFNRLVQKRDAIVESSSGVTRDRHYGQSDWNGKEFSVIDTGGYVEGSSDVFEKAIRRQVEIAMEEADAIIFVVDGRSGLTDMDRDVFNMLRRTDKKVFVAVNKIDTAKNFHDANEFYELGVDKLFPVSAINGGGTGDLLDDVVETFDEKPESDSSHLPAISVVGRPNAGKSSLINLLVGKDRNIVTPVPGTTRDTINSLYKGYGKEFLFVDTAGLRKKSKITDNIEFYSSLRAVRSIEESDVCILMVDATRGFEGQDSAIFSLVARNKKGIVIAVNKWDIMEKSTNSAKEFEKMVQQKIAPFRDIPIVFTSVVKKQRIVKLLETTMQVYENRKRKLSASQLNKDILPLIKDNPPPMYKGKMIRAKYISQLPKSFPAFAIFCNLPQYVKDPYKRFVENKIREHYNFKGAPIEIYFRKK